MPTSSHKNLVGVHLCACGNLCELCVRKSCRDSLSGIRNIHTHMICGSHCCIKPLGDKTPPAKNSGYSDSTTSSDSATVQMWKLGGGGVGGQRVRGKLNILPDLMNNIMMTSGRYISK